MSCLARLRGHAGDPAAAWPANVRERLRQQLREGRDQPADMAIAHVEIHGQRDQHHQGRAQRDWMLSGAQRPDP